MAAILSLTSLAAKLRLSGKHKSLVGRIDQWSHRNSRAFDLEHARQLLEQIFLLRSTNGSELAVNSRLLHDAEGAFFVHAVLLYAKAAESGDRGRAQTFNFNSVLTEDHKATHSDIVALRKTVVAHHDEEAKQSWNKDSVVVVERGDGTREYGFSVSRMLFKPLLAERFAALLSVVCPYAREVLNRDNDDLHAALERAIQEDPDVASQLRQSPFDENRFYGEGSAADEFQRAVEGRRSFVVTSKTQPDS